VPADGIRSGWLVAPGGMSPVSSEPSFSRTRCTALSAFLNATIWPPTLAGFGENDREPLFAVMVMSAGPPVVADGLVGLDDPPPPQLQEPATIASTDVAAKSRCRMAAPFVDDAARRSKRDTARKWRRIVR
jgi:hypothetical protein